MSLKNIVSKVAKLIGLAFIFLNKGELVFAENIKPEITLLKNPYGDPRFQVSDIPLATSVEQCDWSWDRTATYTDAGKVVGKQYEILCLRGMQKPNNKYFKAAVIEAAQAIELGDAEKFNDIFLAWPRDRRKELHDKAFATAIENGAMVSSSIPEWPEGSFEDEFDRFKAEPYHMRVIDTTDVPVEITIEAQPSVKLSLN